MDHKHLTTKVYRTVQFSVVFILSNELVHVGLSVLQCTAVEDFCSFLALRSRIVRGTITTDLGLVAMKA